jgi:hypothetical protein
MSIRLLFVLALLGCNQAALSLSSDGMRDSGNDGPLVLDSHDLANPGCRSQRDCPQDQADECVPVGAVLCGGPACPHMQTCNGDAFCQANGGATNMVCDLTPCCGGPFCISGCASASDCLDGQTCTTTHHCVPIQCGACPLHFVCGPTGACVRQQCSTDADCGTGFCVMWGGQGGCYDALGTCGPIPV